MKAILIDPAAKTLTQVEHNGDYKEIYKLIGADTFDVISIDTCNSMYIDDEGFLQRGKEVFYIDGFESPLCGKALVLGYDNEGESRSTSLSLQQVQQLVRWTNKVGTGEFTQGREGTMNHPVFGKMAYIEGGKPILTEK